MQVWLVAVPVLLGLALLVGVGAARRRDTDHTLGKLSPETVRADRSRERPSIPAPASGREVERAAELHQRAPSGLLVAAPPALPARWVPPDPETMGVTRRQFFNHGILATVGLALSGFGSATLAFLWPTASGGFGSKINPGTLEDIKANIAAGSGFAYYSQGRMWITAYPREALENARRVYDPAVVVGMERGIVALYQKCPHLGCRVPQCVTSQWFECPCHGSQYNQVGEKKGGPAPRGMDRFPVAISGSAVTVDTGTIVQGPPIGTNTTGQNAEGPRCISGASAGAD
jgi:cytochrome b6-f complex iron-sulfur subunit